MAFTNIPPNLQDIFYGITDRIAKLETGPNQAMDWAQSAQSTAQSAQSAASDAQVQAINAAIQANIAQSQATVAQSTATFAQSLAYAASAQATIAQTTADGKNKITYSLSAPGATANNAGDLWFQYSGSGLLIGQFVGLGGTSWQQQTITQAVIGNLDAGKITTGTLNAITINAGTGTQSFNVTANGYMSAQGAYIKGNITADTGTFNGSIYSAQGLFGSGSNYWSIGAQGLTGVGNATISAGNIVGTNITAAQIKTNDFSSQATIFLDSSTNAIRFKTGSAYIANILPYPDLFYQGLILHYGTTPDPTGASYSQVFVGALGAAIAGSSTVGFAAGASSNSIVGSTYCYGNYYLPNHPTTAAAANAWINPSGGLVGRSTASSQDYKTDIVNLTDVPELNPHALYDLPVRAFRFKDDYLPTTDDRSGALVPGFIAEEVDKVYPVAADYVENKGVETWNDRMIIPAMLALIQEQNKRIKILEEKLNTTN